VSSPECKEIIVAKGDPSFQTTRTAGGQKYQLQSGSVARGGGGLAAVPISRVANPPHYLDSGEYDPGDLKEIDKAIRHMPAVVEYLRKKAEECKELTGSDNF
jgi:hypothetical protein